MASFGKFFPFHYFCFSSNKKGAGTPPSPVLSISIPLIPENFRPIPICFFVSHFKWLVTITNNLSGGNQQKVLLARWLLLEPEILILDEPTKGIDVGAKAELYKLMVELSKQGKTIIMITSDMLELLSMSDRVMVMHEGHQVGIIPHTELTQERVLELASG